jgi:hypothetical protein
MARYHTLSSGFSTSRGENRRSLNPDLSPQIHPPGAADSKTGPLKNPPGFSTRHRVQGAPPKLKIPPGFSPPLRFSPLRIRHFRNRRRGHVCSITTRMEKIKPPLPARPAQSGTAVYTTVYISVGTFKRLSQRFSNFSKVGRQSLWRAPRVDVLTPAMWSGVVGLRRAFGCGDCWRGMTLGPRRRLR